MAKVITGKFDARFKRNSERHAELALVDTLEFIESYKFEHLDTDTPALDVFYIDENEFNLAWSPKDDKK